ncbi:Ubiquitin domain-containing protein DSK2b [Phytophthora citrophthora]|uniref:Ubiquitin domain-containing protein DSK2b n=1 Tax=Phytophthora citrophthora TaxID=4793 RepID=A0AAD9H1E0_9STRA|nr:Ubiquitin domain-containing protein DSK2b [Phytophthora citrophthora]
MGRFLGASPTANSERNRRYEMLPGDNEEEDTAHQRVEVSSTSPAAENARVTSPSSATSRSALMRSDSEIEADEAAAAEETQHPTLQRQHQEVAEEGSKEEEETPETQEDKKEMPEDADVQTNNTEGDADPEAINVRILDLNGKFFNIACHLDWNVAQMKQKVMESTEVAVASQRLIYRGRVLEDESSLESYKVEDGHTIHLFVRAAPTPDPEILNTELNANGSTGGLRDDGITVVNINSDIVSSAVFPSDSARRVDPLMLDSPLGNCARRVKLWSSFLLIIYTMKVMGQFALLANDQQQRAAEQERENAGASETDRPMNRYDEYPQYYTPDPLIGGIELLVHCFGVYVGCVGFKAAHDTDIRPIRFYCRGVVWLAILTVAEQIYTTVQISETDFPTERVQYPYGGQGPTKEDIVSANIFQTIMLVVMWLIAIRHSYLHQREVSIYNQSFAAAAMNAVPPVHLPEVV